MITSHKTLTINLYRSVLRLAKVYGSKENGSILCSLLHRSGQDDNVDYIKLIHEKQHGKDFSSGVCHHDVNDSYVLWYKKLVREVLGDKEKVHMMFPSYAEQQRIPDRIINIIQREFRISDDNKSLLSDADRQKTAFLALRELQKKLNLAQSLGLNTKISTKDYVIQRGDDEVKVQAAKHVYPLSMMSPRSYLRPGSYLVAHPFLTGCFSRSVVCILDHSEAIQENVQRREGKTDNCDRSQHTTKTIGGTYGIIVNKVLTGVPNESSEKKRNLSLREIIRKEGLPEGMKIAFEECVVRDGGPVNMSIQMLRAESPDCDQFDIGGSVLPMIANDDNECDSVEGISSAQRVDEAVYYGGDVIRAAQAVIDKEMSSESFSFVIGCSCWQSGQLVSEIKKGYWLPVSAPPRVALTGEVCGVSESCRSATGGSDLWLKFMHSLGRDEGRLGQLLLAYDHYNIDENGAACDEV